VLEFEPSFTLPETFEARKEFHQECVVVRVAGTTPAWQEDSKCQRRPTASGFFATGRKVG
jgi:hypothetical protein